MSNSKNLFIAYCEENSNVAEEISQKLKRAGFKFELVSSKRKDNKDLITVIMEQPSKGLLLISDNFLKSEECIRKTLGFITNTSAFNKVQPIIVDGRYPAKKGSGYEAVHTEFDRVSSVIKYMNYWQEKYLELRKEKRSVTHPDEAAFDEKVNQVKTISSEIGEFLRILRTKNFWNYPDFEKNNFELFFKKFGDDALFKSYKAIAANDPKKETVHSEPDLSVKPEKDTLKKAAEKEIVLPVLEEKIADININKVEKISASSLKEESIPVLHDVPAGDLQKTQTTVPGTKRETQPVFSSSATFEQQVEDIVEEIEQEEQLSSQNPQLDFNQEDDNDYETLASSFEDEEEEEDITSDFESLSEIVPEPDTEKTADVFQNNEVTEPSTEDDFNADEKIFEASTLVEKGKIDEAIFQLKEVLKHQPQNNGARYMYSMLLLNYKEDYGKAQKQLKKVVKTDPQNWEAFEHLAKIAELNNDFPLAKKYYEKVATLKPHTFGIYYKLGLITSGFYNDKKKLALKYFKKAIKQDKSNEDAYYRLGLLLSESFEKPKQALKYFKKVLKINPQHKFANYDLALLYNELDSPKSAALFYARACQVNPEIKTPENDIVFHFNANEEEHTSFEEARHSKETAIPSDESENSFKTAPEPAKVIFITGATSGIGKATAEIFAANGYRLILNGRREDRLLSLQNKFERKYETDIKILPFDVRNMEEVKKAIEDLEDDEWSNIDILINNAGLAKGYAPIHEGNIDHWESMIDTNLKGLLYLTRVIAPHMVKRKSGHIINVCSSAGHEVYPNGNVYCATKFAVDALTKSMRLDLYKHNIRVGQVSPGHVEETEFALVRYDDHEKAKIYEDFQPLKSEDVANVIYFMVTAPPHVNIQDVQLMGTQQASNNFIDRSGR